jgi:LmbE family N-acetylglucosaminyl deacetylase
MRTLRWASASEPLSILCIGAHSDDIEIGAGATILSLLARGAVRDIRWCVLSGGETRSNEAKQSASEFIASRAAARIEVLEFRDGYFPHESAAIKTWFETLKQECHPDVILTHYRDDAHQDHREVARLTWNTFRDHWIMEYEIPKWDGDLGQPNAYVPLSTEQLARKIDLLDKHFGTQRAKHWFDGETFRGLARLRGMECRAPDGYAEAFYARKMTLG